MVNSFGGRSWWCVIVQNSSLFSCFYTYIQLPEFISRICFLFVSYISARNETRETDHHAPVVFHETPSVSNGLMNPNSPNRQQTDDWPALHYKF
jgi:hypothetical protein